MTKEESAKARAVMEAWENGATIQCADRSVGSGNWKNCDPDYVAWAFERFDYRVKPVPMEITVWVETATGEISVQERDALSSVSRWEKKIFREVLT
jgi:hypothetical protein